MKPTLWWKSNPTADSFSPEHNGRPVVSVFLCRSSYYASAAGRDDSEPRAGQSADEAGREREGEGRARHGPCLCGPVYVAAAPATVAPVDGAQVSDTGAEDNEEVDHHTDGTNNN